MQKDAAVSVVLLPCVINPALPADHPAGKEKGENQIGGISSVSYRVQSQFENFHDKSYLSL